MNYRRTFLQALFLFCEDRNTDTAIIATQSGFSLRKLNAEEPFDFTNEQFEAVWKNLVLSSKDELLGLRFGATMQIAALNLIGQIIQTSQTIRDALHHVCSFIHLFTDYYTMRIEEKTRTFSISFHKNEGFNKYVTSQNQVGDFLLAFTVHELKGLLLENPKPLRAGLPTYKKVYDREYENILQCRAGKSEQYFMEFTKEFLDTRIITANYELQNLLISQISQLQRTTTLNGPYSQKIFNFLVANSYLYSLSIETVAGTFNVSVRTLQRKLKSEGVSYLHIMEEVRMALAIHYVKNSTSSIKEISSILGYSEPSGFVRAFKKWTTKTPSEYRDFN